MSWNQHYTQRKQREMTQKAITNSKKKELKPLYSGFGYGNQNTKSYQARRAEELRQDKFAWRVGYCVMAIISIIGCCAVYWAATTSY